MDRYGTASQVDDPDNRTTDEYSAPSGPGSLKETLISKGNISPTHQSRAAIMSGAEKTPMQSAGAPGDSVNGADHVHAVEPLPGWRYAMLGLGLCMGLFLAMLDTSIVTTSLYTIAAEFQYFQYINWVALAYTLTYLGFAVLFSRISDVIGRRAAFLVAFVIFIAFSIGCGFAKSLKQLIVCRALQGLGGSGLYSIAIIIFPELTPDNKKQYIAGIIGMVIAISGVLGPVIGGLLTHYRSWRWVFWINGPIGVFSAAVFWLCWPDKKYLPDIERRKWKHLDYLGSFLLIAASVLICFAFQNGASDTTQWTKAVFIAPLVIGVLSAFGLFAWEYFIERRFRGKLALAIPLELLRNRVYAAGVLNTMFLGFPYLLCIYTFPIRFQVVHKKSPLEAGLMLLPMLAATAIGSMVAGVISRNKNRLHETLVAAGVFMLIGCCLEMLATPSEAYEPKVLGFLVFIGLGFGLSASATTMLGAIEAPIREHAPAQGIIAQLRILGGSIGIAASSAIVGVKTRDQLAGVLDGNQLQGLAAQISSLTPEQYAAVRVAYTDALREEMSVCAVVLAVGIILTFGTYRKKRVSILEQQRLRVLEEQERRAASKAPVPAAQKPAPGSQATGTATKDAGISAV